MNTLLRGAAAACALFLATGAQAQGSGKADLEAVQRAMHVCAACHGEGGRSTDARYPSLAGQMRDYTVRQLRDFRSQTRSESNSQAYMWGISALLTDEVIDGLADYYAQQTPAPGKVAAGTRKAVLAQGQRLFAAGIPDRGVRACASCHGDKGEGASAFPRLAGQQAAYVYRQLKGFGTPLRPHGVIMKNEVKALNDAQLRALASYVQSL